MAKYDLIPSVVDRSHIRGPTARAALLHPRPARPASILRQGRAGARHARWRPTRTPAPLRRARLVQRVTTAPSLACLRLPLRRARPGRTLLRVPRRAHHAQRGASRRRRPACALSALPASTRTPPARHRARHVDRVTTAQLAPPPKLPAPWANTPRRALAAAPRARLGSISLQRPSMTA